MSQPHIQNRQDSDIASIGKQNIGNTTNQNKSNSNQINQLSNQGGNSKRNKRNKKQGQMNNNSNQNSQGNNNLDQILSGLEKKQYESIDTEFLNNQNSKLGKDFVSLVDSTELHNNTIEHIRRKLSDQNVLSPIDLSEYSKPMAGYQNKNSNGNKGGSSSSSSLSSSNINQKITQNYEDGFITVKSGDYSNRVQMSQSYNPQQGQKKGVKSQNQNSQTSYTINATNSINSTYQVNGNKVKSSNNTNNQQKLQQDYIQNSQLRKSDDQILANFHNNNFNNQHDNRKRNSTSAHYENNYQSLQASPPKINVLNSSSIYNSQTNNLNQQNNNLKTSNNNQNDYINQSPAHKQKQVQQKGSQNSDPLQDSLDLTTLSSQQDSIHDNSQQKLKRKKTNKSKSIVNNSEVGLSSQQQQKDGSQTTPNDGKMTKDDTNFTSIHCLESVNQASKEQTPQNNQQNFSVTSNSCSVLASAPSLREKSQSIQGNPEEKEKEEGSLAIFRCPIALEKYNIKLWIVYIDNLIEVMFKLPIELITLVFEYIVYGKKLNKKDFNIWVHFLLIFIPVLIFTDNLYIIEMKEYFDVSYWYHAFRGQSTLKLYGVLMTADVVDKMLCTFGEYLVLDVLWQKIPKCTPLNVIKYLIPGILYVFMHSLVLFLSIIGHNVILNSDISFLFVMVFVHNSMKLKSTIFKKFNKDGYVQQTHQDLRSRFSKCLYVFLIWASMRGFSQDIVRKLFYFLGSEVIIEWVKHIFLMLLNNLKLSIVESMSKSCKIFVAQVRIIPAFQPQEIMNNKAMQTFLERENYLAQTPYVSPSLKIGFRINFLAFHHAVIVIKILYPLMEQYFSYHNFWIAIFCMRLFQIINDLLIYKFSFNNNELIKLYTLKNQSLFKTLFNKLDILFFLHGIFSIYKSYKLEVLTAFTDVYQEVFNKI